MITVTASQMKHLDQVTIEQHGMPSLVLMERAALACVQVLRDWQFDLTRVVVVCGPGNNGGDGLAIARLLHLAGVSVMAALVGDESRRTDETRQQLAIAQGYGLGTSPINAAPANPTTVIDALLGIGGARAPEGEFADAIRYMNGCDAPILAVDMPSGVSADTGEAPGEAVRAKVTVTFAYAKVGLTVGAGSELAGTVLVKDIGIYQPVDN